MTVPIKKTLLLKEFPPLVGQEIGLSDWITVDQAMIDGFADVTRDHQFIHTDPEAAAEGPFGATVAHGFLTLSLLSTLAYEAVPVPESATASINYGVDRIRFLSPVRSGARLRGRFILRGLERGDGVLTLSLTAIMECEGEERPALAAEWIVRLSVT